MAGIADQPAAQLQLGASSPIAGGEPDVNVTLPGLSQQTTQNFDNLMGAFRSGFITADDIKKRQIVGTTDAEAMREENIARKVGAQQSQIDIGEVRPRQRELAKAQLEGATGEQTLLNRMNSSDTNVSHPAREEFASRQLDAQATAVYGTPTPNLFKPTEREPEDFDTWKNRQVNAFQGSDTARAEYSNHLDEKGEQGEEYAKYKKAVKEEKVPLTPGTPEYRKALREHVHEALTYEQLAQINFDVMKESAIARGKAEAERPVKNEMAASKLREELKRDDRYKEFAKAGPQYQSALLNEQTLNSKTDEEWRKNPETARALDISIAFNYFKMLHPDTRVTEENFRHMESVSPVEFDTDELRDIRNKFIRKTYLDPQGRRALIEQTKEGYQAYARALQPQFESVKGVARRNGIAPEDVVTPEEEVLMHHALNSKAAPTSPKTALPANFAPPTSKEIADAPTYPALNAVPSNVRVYKTPDGKPWGNPNYKP